MANAYNMDKNPWYLLATAYGDPYTDGNYDEATAEKNRRVWNKWAETQDSRDEWGAINAIKEKTKGLAGMQAGNAIQKLVNWVSEDLDAVWARFRKADISPNEIPSAYDVDNRDGVRFENQVFLSPVNMTGFCLKMGLVADRADFRRGAVFSDIKISAVSFHGAEFKGNAVFNDTEFETANFEGAVFYKEATFSKTTIARANFEGARFDGKADFEGATFSK